MKLLNNLKLAFILFILAYSHITLAGDKISPLTVDGASTIDTAKAKQLFDAGTLFVDTRKDKDWQAGRIPDALHLNVKTALTEAALLEEAGKTDKIVFYCNGESCMRSSNASILAVKWGFTQVFYYRDGFPAWKTAGYPVE